ncbi:MAG: 2-hydroxyacyl-CoA dehydratase family protein [Anaerolineae bacterium]|nr:2-hydroxyacyl-CoA dehydratase family protein [Anaerolineae bacterium]
MGRYARLESALDLSQLMERHYAEALDARHERPVAWVNAGAPVELLRAMGVLAVYPENYAAMCGVRGAVWLCEAAEREGYSRDLCSYARISLGAGLSGPSAPQQGLGRPDLLISCNNSCGTIVKWFEALARLYGVPLFVLDTPFVHDELPAHTVAYVAAQLHDLIHWLEACAGCHLDSAALEEALQFSRETTLLWREIRELCRTVPSPLNAPDLFIHMAPIVVLRGSPEAAAYYRRLRREVLQRVRQGVGAIPNERYRLLWDNIAIWPRLSQLFYLFAARGACFVVDTYTGAWDAVPEEGDPLESLARVYTEIYLNRSLAYRVGRMQQLMREYSCHGFLMHNNRSCKAFSLGQPVARRELTAATGAPGLLLEADMCDTRAYTEQQIRTRVEAFLETVAGRAG